MLRACCLALLPLPLLAGAAGAQSLRAHVPLGPTERPLHQRLALADVVAVGTVQEVELGRIQIRNAQVLAGSGAESFALKRAPSRPPPLESGDRAVLLLRGARPPYVLVDDAEELVVLPDAEAETRWRRALREAHAALHHPASLRDLYLVWLSGPDAGLRHAAQLGLAAPHPPFAALPDEVVRKLVRRAADPAVEPEQRRAAAYVALRSESGAEALLSGLPGDPADLPLLQDALRMAALRGSPELWPLLARTLSHPSAEVRRTGLALGRIAAGSPESRPALERMARQDPVEELRDAAARALERAR